VNCCAGALLSLGVIVGIQGFVPGWVFHGYVVFRNFSGSDFFFVNIRTLESADCLRLEVLAFPDEFSYAFTALHVTFVEALVITGLAGGIASGPPVRADGSVHAEGGIVWFLHADSRGN